MPAPYPVEFRQRAVELARENGKPVSESFFATLQAELLDRRVWATRTELAQAIFEYIEGFYNPERRHSRLDYLSPAQYRQRHHTTISVVA